MTTSAWKAAHREEINARARAYRETHREQIKAYRRAYRTSHPETSAARSARYRRNGKHRHRDTRNQSRAWREAHPIEVRAYRQIHGPAYHAAYRENHPEVSLAGERVRIDALPKELQPVALAIREARQEIRKRTHHG